MLTLPVDFLHRQFFNNSVQTWLGAALAAAVALFIGLIARRLLVSRLAVLAKRTSGHIDDMLVELIAGTRTWVLVALAILIGVAQLILPARIERFIDPVWRLVLLWQAAVWGVCAIRFWGQLHLQRRASSQDQTSIAMINAMAVGAKVALWVLIALTAMKSVFGVEITALITGLGVGGIAIALAVQNVLGDLLAALAIVFDKPFDVGDSIGVDNMNGTVEHIGLKTTRIRSVTGEQIIIGNSDLLKSRLRNFRRMTQRRVAFNLDVTYDTPSDVLAKLPAVVEQIVAAQTPVRFDRSHVASFGESAIRVETVYYVLDPDYKKYMDIQQAINLEILNRFTAEEVKFAFPSHTLYHEGLTAKDIAVEKQPQDTTTANS